MYIWMQFLIRYHDIRLRPTMKEWLPLLKSNYIFALTLSAPRAYSKSINVHPEQLHAGQFEVNIKDPILKYWV